jgi:hypothetical protein
MEPEYDPMVTMLIVAIGSNLFLLCVPGAWILQYAARQRVGRAVGFDDAFTTLLLTLLAFAPFAFLLAWTNTALGLGWVGHVAAQVLLLPLGFVMLCGLISRRHSLPFRTSVHVAVGMTVIALRVLAVFGAFALISWGSYISKK